MLFIVSSNKYCPWTKRKSYLWSKTNEDMLMSYEMPGWMDGWVFFWGINLTCNILNKRAAITSLKVYGI